jgi:hypothetical protein
MMIVVLVESDVLRIELVGAAQNIEILVNFTRTGGDRAL